jgi:arginase family enzyme
VSRPPAPGPEGMPVEPWDLGPFGGIATFAARPYQQDPSGADVAVVGVPYDSAITFRSGARFGPRGIRVASQALRPYNFALDVAPFELLEVVDAGDVPVAPAYHEETQRRITAVVGRLVTAVPVVVALGGDHSVSLPLLRAQHRHRGAVALVHLDAHPDTWTDEFGMRGPTDGPEDLQRSRDLGYHMITGEDFWDLACPARWPGSTRWYAGPPTSRDVDVADPAYAPGTGTPEVGGLTSRQPRVRGAVGAGARQAGRAVDRRRASNPIPATDRNVSPRPRGAVTRQGLGAAQARTPLARDRPYKDGALWGKKAKEEATALLPPARPMIAARQSRPPVSLYARPVIVRGAMRQLLQWDQGMTAHDRSTSEATNTGL